MAGSLPDRMESVFWRRHSNPRSGWSRVPTGPVLVYAVYRRDGRLLLAALAWAAINPFLFPPPGDEDAKVGCKSLPSCADPGVGDDR